MSGARLMILTVALSFIVAGRQRLALYLVEEAFTVLLSIAVIFTVAWITLSAFLLLWQGASLVFLQLKGIIRRGTGMGDRPTLFSGSLHHSSPSRSLGQTRIQL